MKASEVPIGAWFMVTRTKQWYKRLPDTSDSGGILRAGKVETHKVFYIDLSEEVQLIKK